MNRRPNDILRLDYLVQYMDVMQTLLALADGDTGQVPGGNLDEEDSEWAVSKPYTARFDEFFEPNPAFDISRFQESELPALRTPRFKCKRSYEGSELFALPVEEINLINEYTDLRDDVNGRLEAWLEGILRPVGTWDEGEFTDMKRGQLSNVGSLE